MQAACMLFACIAMPAQPSSLAAEKAAGRALAAHARARQWKEALRLLRSLPERGVNLNTRHYNAAINACSRGGRWSMALKLLDEMVDFGYPQTTDAKILQEYITQVRVENNRMLIYRGSKMYIPMFSRRVTSSRPRPSLRPR